MTYIQRIRTKLAIQAHRKVSGFLDGQYASTVAGRSLDFADLREYVLGDDVRDLDWKATARHGRPLVRRYVADRKHTLSLTIATGRGMAAQATPTEVKSDIALTCAGLLAYLALTHGDYVGAYLTHGDDPEAWRPSTREVDVERMLRRAAELCSLTAPDADLTETLSFVAAATRRRTILLLITDDVDLTQEQEALLGRLAVQHEILWVSVRDLAPGDDGVDGRRLLQLDSAAPVASFARTDPILSAQIRALEIERLERRSRLCARLGVAHEQIASADAVIPGVLRLLERGRHGIVR